MKNFHEKKRILLLLFIYLFVGWISSKLTSGTVHFGTAGNGCGADLLPSWILFELFSAPNQEQGAPWLQSDASVFTTYRAICWNDEGHLHLWCESPFASIHTDRMFTCQTSIFRIFPALVSLQIQLSHEPCDVMAGMPLCWNYYDPVGKSSYLWVWYPIYCR